MDSSRSASASVAIMLCFLGIVVSSLSFSPSYAEPDALKIVDPPPQSDDKTPQDWPAAFPEAPIATGLMGKSIYLHAIKTIAFSPDGRSVAVAGGEGIVRLWEFETQKLIHAQKVHESWVFDLEFHPDGKSFATAGGDNLIKQWESGKQWEARLFEGHTDDVHGVAFTPKGQKLVSGSDDTTVRIWDRTTGKAQLLQGHSKQVTAVAMHPKGILAASASRDGTIRLWDLNNSKAVAVFKGHTADVIAVEFSADGKLMASTGYDGLVIVWDVAQKQPRLRLNKHEGWTFCVAFSPDSKQLASGGGDGKLLLWDLPKGELKQTLDLKSDVSAVAFSPDGRHFVAGAIDGYAQLYRVKDQLVHFGVIPPSVTYRAIPPEKKPISIEESLNLHLKILSPEHDDWDAAVGQLSTSGDEFTLFLLDRIDPDSLNPPKREMWTRSRKTLNENLPSRTVKQKTKQLSFWLNRAATADLQPHPLKGLLQTWTLDHLRGQLAIPQLKSELERIRSEPLQQDQTLIDEARHKRVQYYLDQILVTPLAE